MMEAIGFRECEYWMSNIDCSRPVYLLKIAFSSLLGYIDQSNSDDWANLD